MRRVIAIGQKWSAPLRVRPDFFFETLARRPAGGIRTRTDQPDSEQRDPERNSIKACIANRAGTCEPKLGKGVHAASTWHFTESVTGILTGLLAGY